MQVHEARMAAEKDVDMAVVAMEVSERNVLMMSTSYVFKVLLTDLQTCNEMFQAFFFFVDNVLNCSTYLRKPQLVGKDCPVVLH